MAFLIWQVDTDIGQYIDIGHNLNMAKYQTINLKVPRKIYIRIHRLCNKKISHHPDRTGLFIIHNMLVQAWQLINWARMYKTSKKCS